METTTRKVIREAVAGELGLLHEDVVASVPSGVGNDQLELTKLADLTPDPERIRDSFIFHPNGTNYTNWRRILKFNFPASQKVSVTRAFDPVPVANEPVQVYFMLDIDEWNRCIDEALKDLFFVDRTAITWVNSPETREYALPSWIQYQGQVLYVRNRYTATGKETEEGLGSYSLIEDANAVTLKLPHAAPDTNTYQGVVAANHPYSALANDASTTTCPYPLLKANVKVHVLHKIFTKFGQTVKKNYGQAIMIAEKDLADAKAKWMPPLVARDYILEDEWDGPNISPVFRFPSW